MEYLLYSRDSGRSEQRGMENGPQLSNSPVKLFGQAKERVIDIFKEIAEYIDEIDLFVQEIRQSGCIEGLDFGDKIKGFRENVTGIIGVLARDHMKVAFFGRTSNGKSTVMNAMLRENILPSGMGHTTSCFLQVEGGSDSEKAFLLTEDQPDEPKNIQSIKQLAHALSSVKLQSSSLIRIVWPKEKCRLLKEDVVFVDSPGIDVTRDLDTWIDKFCLDADVFVVVSNAESTLSQTEKNFFLKVNERLSKPNLFIVQNRWDNSELEEDVEKVKQQHLEWNVKFLVDELGMTDTKQAYERVFFVSAREALVSRLNQDKGTPIPNGILQEGFQARLFEFANFEQKFEECIAMSAVRTKFEQLTQRGKEVTGDLRAQMDKIVKLNLEQSNSKKFESQKKANELENTKKQLSVLKNELKNKIEALGEDVEEKALNEHVDERLRGSLQETCSADLKSRFEATQAEIIEKLAALIPEEKREQIKRQAPTQEFEIEYRLGYRSICAHFQENLKFPWRTTRLMQRFLGYSDTVMQHVPRPISGTFQSPVSEQYEPFMTEDCAMMATLHTMFASPISRTTVTSLVVGGLVFKAVGSKMTAVAGICLMSCIGGLSMYERVKWTITDKERTFKKQYVDYVGKNLHFIVNQTTRDCSRQVQRELNTIFGDLCGNVDESTMALENEIKQLDDKIAELLDVTKKATVVRNKTDRLVNELNRFTVQYLTAAAL